MAILWLQSVTVKQANGQAICTLKPTPKTVAWAYDDAKAAPGLRVKSGDIVEIQTLITKIGRAGWRETVEISEDGGSLKKNTRAAERARVQRKAGKQLHTGAVGK